MKVFVALLSLVAVASAGQTFLGGAYGYGGLAAPYAAAGISHTGQSVSQRAEDGVGNYQFAYQEQHGTGGTARQESGDIYGRKVGSYSMGIADGRERVVHYVADEHGFRAQVQTNEPGTAPQQPADVVMNAAPQAVAHVAPVAPAPVAAPIVAPRPIVQAPIVAPRPIVQAPIYQAPIVQKQIFAAPIAQPIVQQHVVAHAAPIVQKQIVAAPVARPIVQAPLYGGYGGYGYGGYGYGAVAAPHAYGSVVKHISAAPGLVGAYGLGHYGAGLGYTHGLAATGLGLGAVYGAPLYVK